MVKAFGAFVVGGNVVVGLVIFLILIVIQFVVITNGAGRVAEVGARFTLDAMPGKQMAIDADLNAGLITDDQARARRVGDRPRGRLLRRHGRRLEVRQGRRDGGCDHHRDQPRRRDRRRHAPARAGLRSEATHQYSLLTVGDGLAAQIPALLISVATGIIVTRAASDRDLGSDIAGQILSQRKAPLVAAAAIGGFALIPGLPKLPFLFIAAIFGAIGWGVRNGNARCRRRRTPEPPRRGARPAGRRRRVALRRSGSMRSSWRSASGWFRLWTAAPVARCCAESA